MAAAPKRSGPKVQGKGESLPFAAHIMPFYLEGMQLVVQKKVEATLRQWIAKSDLGDEPAAVAEAFLLAMDLEMFTASLSGTTVFDRIARSRKMSDAEAAVIAAIKGARFTPLRILAVAETTFSAVHIVTGAVLSIDHEPAPLDAIGVTVLARLCTAPDGTITTIGPVTPVDEAGLAVAMDFVRPGRGIVNDQRCAAAVYRHVVRHGGPSIRGFNGPADDTDDDDGLDEAPSELDAMAVLWSARAGEEPPQADLDVVRSLATVDSILETLFKAVTTRKAGLASFEAAYRRMAEVQMETLQRRASVGSGRDPNPFDTIARAVDHEIAHEDYPDAARELFRALRRTVSATTAKPKQNDDELGRIIERIRALRAKTIDQGCTESEAMAAAKKVAELLDRYGLSLSEIDIRQQTCQGIGIETNRKRTSPLDECLPGIAAFCDCKAWQEKTTAGTIRSVFFGLPADVEAAHYLYDRVAMAFETETKAFQAGPLYTKMVGGGRRTATNSFQIGLSRGIRDKLFVLKTERDTAFRTETGRDLVPLKTSVIEDDLAKLGMAFKVRTQAARRIQVDAFEAGEVAGRKFEARSGLEQEN